MKKNKESKKNIILISIISALIVILDQKTKFLISKSLELGQKINIIPNVLNINYILNTGAGFGILKNTNLFLIFASIIIIGIIIYNYKKIPIERFPQIMISFILGGAIGNLIDRIFRQQVIDFIDFIIWPSFTVADSVISIGAVGLIIYFWKK